MVVAGMPATPDEARQVGRYIANRRAARNACGPEVEGACRGFAAVIDFHQHAIKH